MASKENLLRWYNNSKDILAWNKVRNSAARFKENRFWLLWAKNKLFIRRIKHTK